MEALGFVSKEMALDILGIKNVMLKRESAQFWSTANADRDFSIPYLPDQLIACARDNEKGNSQWKLVFLNGIPPLYMLRFRYPETLGKRSVCDEAFSWDEDIPGLAKEATAFILDHGLTMWAQQIRLPGYRLINFAPKERQLSWSEQSRWLAESKLSRADERDVLEALISFAGIHRIELCEIAHWGNPLEKGRNPIKVRYTSCGISIDDRLPAETSGFSWLGAYSTINPKT